MTIKKSSKIDFYKFVKPPKMVDSGDDKDRQLSQVFQTQVVAFNRLGKTLNSIGTTMIEFRKTQTQIYEAVSKQSKTGFVAKFNLPTAPKKSDDVVSKDTPKAETPSWLESILDVLSTAYLVDLL